MRSPEPGPRVPGAGGVEIATYHFGGDGPPVMLLHAAGFHGRCWLPLVPALGNHFNVWSVDQRGHGSSGKALDGRYDDWGVFVDDLLAVLDELGLEGWRGLGHSLGGTILLLAEHRRPGTFTDFCLYEPVVLPPASEGEPERRTPMSELVRKRRASFASREVARQNFAAKPPMNRFDPAALDAYVAYGVVDDPRHGVTLACQPEDEASVYEGARTSGAWGRLGEIRPPVAVLGGGDADDPVGRLVEDVARRLPRGGSRRVSRLSHFGPFEDPGGVGRLAMQAFGAEGRSTMNVAPSR